MANIFLMAFVVEKVERLTSRSGKERLFITTKIIEIHKISRKEENKIKIACFIGVLISK